ncbi:TPA: hypothetical protein ACXJVA_000508 [Pseudomonas aeruginosa]|uniref:hypothetical protein n=1 Tax=Pseudomonas aeruginosa TaxID=287 RepID=UPI001571717C|nr:hypothetical protein [Pseudomonas aeruginosa]MBU8390351.1 hypothetical protein [Pseudomonas aeruginosa]MBY1012393.1 hypothetical protein [Pseudomonas aeruginosa]MCV4185709.1 hypothetical protein [Pseudomonas aeruginosa]NTS90785.1 hypothetical protein [Pseudomonas aeruginosa]HCL3574213.1 hypothetical protein [Pseudomonas aeruginosa]
MLYVLPASLPIPQLSPRARYSVRMTQGLKISAQLELNADQPEELECIHIRQSVPSPG